MGAPSAGTFGTPKRIPEHRSRALIPATLRSSSRSQHGICAAEGKRRLGSGRKHFGGVGWDGDLRPPKKLGPREGTGRNTAVLLSLSQRKGGEQVLAFSNFITLFKECIVCVEKRPHKSRKNSILTAFDGVVSITLTLLSKPFLNVSGSCF